MAWKDHKLTIEVLGRRMAYIDDGAPIVLLHGNPTSSYLWRDVLPELDGLGRCLAPDLLGMFDSAKLADDDQGRYSFACHREFLDAFLDAVGVRDDVTLVLHDWGNALGFDWARRHPGAVRAIAYMEAIVRPFAGWEHWSEKSRGIFQALRSPAGEQMVLDENPFVEKILPMAVLRELTDEEMAGVPPAVRCPGRRPSADARVAAPAADRGRRLPTSSRSATTTPSGWRRRRASRSCSSTSSPGRSSSARVLPDLARPGRGDRRRVALSSRRTPGATSAA